MFDDVILQEDADSVVFFYSTENINYYQRREAFQVNLVAKTLKAIPKVEDKINFYSYDVTLNGMPNGIPNMGAPPHDIIRSEKDRTTGLPTTYVFPAGQKTMPYIRYMELPMAENIIGFIKEISTQYLPLNLDNFKHLGIQNADADDFIKRL